MLRHLGKEPQALAIEGEVAGFFAAGGEPVAVKIEGGGFEIVGVTHDMQDGAAPAGDQAGFDVRVVGRDRPVGADAQVDMVIGGIVGAAFGMPDIEGLTVAGMQAVGAAPGDEALDAGTQGRRVAAMFDDGDLCGRHVADGHVGLGEALLHQEAPCMVERVEGIQPRLPVGGFAEVGGGLPEPLSEGAGKGVRRLISRIQRDLCHTVPFAEGQLV